MHLAKAPPQAALAVTARCSLPPPASCPFGTVPPPISLNNSPKIQKLRARKVATLCAGPAFAGLLSVPILPVCDRGAQMRRRRANWQERCYPRVTRALSKRRRRSAPGMAAALPSVHHCNLPSGSIGLIESTQTWQGTAGSRQRNRRMQLLKARSATARAEQQRMREESMEWGQQGCGRRAAV